MLELEMNRRSLENVRTLENDGKAVFLALELEIHRGSLGNAIVLENDEKI